MHELDLPQTEPIPVRVKRCIIVIFCPDSSPEHVCEAILHISNIFLSRSGFIEAEKHVSYDLFSMKIAVERFQRDAFGVRNFQKYIEGKRNGEKISDECAQDVLQEIQKLGIRINTSSPRKTRIVAAFLLWMSTFRPISLVWNNDVLEMLKKDKRDPSEISARVFWQICHAYLKQYGDLTLVKGEETSNVRLERIFRDLTVRNISLSSIELFMSGVFRPKTA